MPVLLLLPAGVVVLFAIAIYFSLRFRERAFAENLQVSARDIWNSFQSSQWRFENLLYGVWRDFSMAETGMIVRDFCDRQTGTIVYHAGRRQGWITVTAGEAIFEADVLPRLRWSAALRGLDGNAYCIINHSRSGEYRFDLDGGGAIERTQPARTSAAPVYAYRWNGRPAGVGNQIGKWRSRGVLLILPSEIPLPVRMFILALQGKRS